MKTNCGAVCLRLVMLCTVLGSCFGLECYSCSGSGSCADPLNTTDVNKETCTEPDQTVCNGYQNRRDGSFIRGCSIPGACSPTGCTVGDVDICQYCCEGDLCNDMPIADAVADVLHCYKCRYKSELSVIIGTEACNDPFDPAGDEVHSSPCNGTCGVSRFMQTGVIDVIRKCFVAANDEQCEPGCEGDVCWTCCSDDLCNGGTSPTASAPSTTSQGTTLKTGVTTVLLVSLGLHVL